MKLASIRPVWTIQAPGGPALSARHFRLDFVPIATERYFLLCRDDVLPTPACQKVLALLRDPDFRAVLAELPGYDPEASGTVTPLAQAYPVFGEGAEASGAGTPARVRRVASRR